jgi:TetR/AcrR family transcriptional repressor of nem operon
LDCERNTKRVRYLPGHRHKTHARIVEAASRLFKARGFAATGIDAVMQAAGLTAGGFYAHFSSKDALFAEALDASLTAQSAQWTADGGDAADAGWVRNFIEIYLSEAHRDGVATGCTISCLGPEVARAGKVPRRIFEEQIRGFLTYLERKLGKRAAFAIPIFTLCIGGVMLARAVADREYSNSILAACRSAALRLAESGQKGQRG